MATTSDVGNAFMSGRSLKGSNINSEKHGNFSFLIGYGWAVYGMKNMRTGDVIYFSKWHGYTMTTSKQLSVSGISYNHTFEIKERPEVSDITELMKKYEKIKVNPKRSMQNFM